MERAHAERLLGDCEAYLASRNEGTRRASYLLGRVVIRSLMGRKEEALAALRRAIDDGYRRGLWWLQVQPFLDPIRGDPRFLSMMKEIRTDIDRMRRAAAAAAVR